MRGGVLWTVALALLGAPSLALADVADPDPLAADPRPTVQTRVYYNARMALREGRPLEAIELWFLRNAIASETGAVSAHDVDLRSNTWAALGALGFCPDGFAIDDDGVGLWPLALHNWTVRNRRPAPPADAGSPFDAFSVGRQQRWVALSDVLDADEIEALRLRRTGCWWSYRLVLAVDWRPWAELTDSRIAARAMRALLLRSLKTLDWDRVIGRAAIEARIFDLELRLTGLGARARRKARREMVIEGRRQGLKGDELTALGRDAMPTIDPTSVPGRILARSFAWSAEEWLTMSPQRRQYLFAHAMRSATLMRPPRDPTAAHGLILDVVDRLIARQEGVEVQGWIAHMGDDEAARAQIWGGDRGAALMSLDDDSGFRERGPIALHRGVDLLGRGDLPGALRTLALASKWAPESRLPTQTGNLARRWLSFVAAQFAVTDELLAMLREVVPRTDFNAVLEDQLWHAALNADQPSFDRCVRYQVGRGALVQRAALLRPLALGDAGAFATAMRDSIDASPFFAVRFLGQFLERLSAEESAVRARFVPILQALKARLERLAEEDASGRGQRRVLALIERIRAIVDGLVPVRDDASSADRAKGLSPDRALYAGSVRIAPSDPLPWPFRVPIVRAPSVFLPLALVPVEWRMGEGGERVFGWRVQEP